MLGTLRRTLAPLVLAIAVVVPGAQAAAAVELSRPALTAAPVVAPQTQGIIMRDGGICDPIRHIGC